MEPVSNTLAVFIDFENLAQGLPKSHTLEMTIVLERLVEKGKVVVKKAYADWARYAKPKQALHELAIDLIEIPKRSMTGKNSADIRLCVDAMDLCYSKTHVDTFVIVSGDSDFSPPGEQAQGKRQKGDRLGHEGHHQQSFARQLR